MDIQRPQPTYKPATTVQPGAVSEMKVMRAPEGQSKQVEPQEGKAARIRGGGAAKDCLITALACCICFECCESLCDCVASIICCPCEVLC